MDPNDPLAYAPGLEIHHPTMSMLGGHGGQLERYSVCVLSPWCIKEEWCSLYISHTKSLQRSIERRWYWRYIHYYTEEGVDGQKLSDQRFANIYPAVGISPNNRIFRGFPDISWDGVLFDIFYPLNFFHRYIYCTYKNILFLHPFFSITCQESGHTTSPVILPIIIFVFLSTLSCISFPWALQIFKSL